MKGTVEGRIGTVVAAIKELEPYLIGKDPRQPAHHWQAIYRQAFYRGDIVLTSALSAVDIAMWDIKGKALGVPVYELLGGPTRDRIRVYGQAENVEAARAVLAEGYTSMKTSVTDSRGRPSRYSENPDFIEGFVEKVAAIREVVGPKVDLGIEMHADSQPQVAMVDHQGAGEVPALVVRGADPAPEPAADGGDGQEDAHPVRDRRAHGDEMAVPRPAATWARPSSCSPTSPIAAASPS